MKKKLFKFLKILLISPMLLVAACSCGKNSSAELGSLPSVDLKAGGIAYEAFKSTLTEQKAYDTELSNFSKSIDNYDVGLVDNGDSVTFIFKIKLFHGRMLKDGWFTYAVRKSDWSVHRMQQ